MPDAVIQTVVLRLHRPSRRKQALLQRAFERYAEGLQLMLDRLAPEAERLASQRLCPSLTALSRLMTPEDLRRLKPLGLEPLADGLRMDLAMLLLNYLAHVRNGQPASLPVIRRTPDEWQALALELIARCTEGSLPRRHLHNRLERTLATVGRCKSIYFGRHDATRDFCLLHQPDTGRFFAKLYLMNRQAARQWAAPTAGHPDRATTTARPGAVPQAGIGAAGGPLYHMTEGHPAMMPARPGDRFIILPLNMGSRQHGLLLKAWQHPGMIRTARLCSDGKHFDLHVQLRQSLPEPRQALHLLGLVRSQGAAATFSLCRPDGRVIHQGSLDGPPPAVCDAVCQLARQTSAQVVLPDLAHRRDSLYRTDPAHPGDEPFSPVLSRQQWLALATLLGRQLPLAGLPRPVAVSPYHLYQTCPACQSRRKANRLRDSLLVCTACGNSQPVDEAGSLNVVHKYMRYQLQRQQPAESDRTVP